MVGFVPRLFFVTATSSLLTRSTRSSGFYKPAPAATLWYRGHERRETEKRRRDGRQRRINEAARPATIHQREATTATPPTTRNDAMNKKQLAAYAQTIAEQISNDAKVTLDEAQVLVGLALQRLRARIVDLATPKSDETAPTV